MVGSVNWIHENWVNVLWLAVIVAGVGWLALQTVRQSTDPLRLIIKWIVTAVILGFIFKTIVPGFAKGGGDAIAALILMLLCGGALNIIWRHSLIEVIAKPFSSLYDGGTEPPEPKPYYSIAAASVLAKVTRDRLLLEFDRQFPEYGFAGHKGYGTARHLAAIAAHGPCPIHRKSFAPLKQIVHPQISQIFGDEIL